MDTLLFYFPLGWEHILSLDALDHQAFLAAMGASFLLQDWKRLLVVVTAFTLGHSLTLALSVLNVFSVNSQWVELLIPVTISLTAVQHLLRERPARNKTLLLYASALFFGFIHGMGFAGALRSILSQSDSIFFPLLSVNLGLEIGQLIILSVVWLLSYAFLYFANCSEAEIKKYLSLMAWIGGVYFTLLHLPING